MRKVATALASPKALLREGLASLLADTDYKPSRCVACLEDLTADDAALDGVKLIIISADAMPPRCEKTSRPTLQSLCQLYPDARILILSDTLNTEDVAAALRAGVNGYLLNTVSPEVLIKSLDLVMLGETVLASEFSRTVWQAGLGATAVVASEDQSEVAKGGTSPSPHPMKARQELRSFSTRETAILARLVHGELQQEDRVRHRHRRGNRKDPRQGDPEKDPGPQSDASGSVGLHPSAGNHGLAGVVDEDKDKDNSGSK